MDLGTQRILGGSTMIVGGGTTISNSVAIGAGISKALTDVGIAGLTATGAANLATVVGLTLTTCGIVIVGVGVAQYVSTEMQKA